MIGGSITITFIAPLLSDDLGFPGAPYTDEDLDRYASELAAAIPREMYSFAQVQGYLLTKKQDMLGAVQGVQGLLVNEVQYPTLNGDGERMSLAGDGVLKR
ncbi:hypothetical protein C8R44DRAFT_886915 [Mycena epipterygia]|nr:hypothetical protein C8R44DRAFT_886915 [Mycena epipterygia]